MLLRCRRRLRPKNASARAGNAGGAANGTGDKPSNPSVACRTAPVGSSPLAIPLSCTNCSARRPLRLGGVIVCRFCGWVHEVRA